MREEAQILATTCEQSFQSELIPAIAILLSYVGGYDDERRRGDK